MAHLEQKHDFKLKITKEIFEVEIELMRKEPGARIQRFNKEMVVTLESIGEQYK